MSKKPWLLISFLIVCGVLPVMAAAAFYINAIYKNEKAKKEHAALIAAHPLNEQSVIADINAARTARGVSPLSVNNDLMRSTKLKCEDMVAGNYYEHSRPSDGKKGSDWIRENTKNLKLSNENLNKGVFDNSKSPVDSWLASPAHMNTLLDPKFTDTGVAICDQGTEKIVVEHFAAYYSQAEINAYSQPSQTAPVATQRPQSCTTRYNPGMPEYGLNPWATTTCL